MPQEIAGHQLLAFAGYIELDELQKMSQAIEEDCTQVDLNELTLVSHDQHFSKIDGLQIEI